MVHKNGITNNGTSSERPAKHQIDRSMKWDMITLALKKQKKTRQITNINLTSNMSCDHRGIKWNQSTNQLHFLADEYNIYVLQNNVKDIALLIVLGYICK